MAGVALAWQLVVGARYGFVPDAGAALAEGQSLVVGLLERAPDNADVHAVDGAVQVALGRFHEAFAACERAIAIAPSHATNQALLALTHVFAGNWEEGLVRIRAAIRLSPYFPDWFLVCLSEGYRGTGDLDRARAVVEHWVARAPDSMLSWVRLARICVDQGDMSRARVASEMVRALEVEFSVEALSRSMPFGRPEDRAAFAAALREAGLPG